MPVLRVTYGNVENILSKSKEFNYSARVGDKLLIEGGDLFHTWIDEKLNTFYLFGKLLGVRQVDGTLSSPSLISVLERTRRRTLRRRLLPS